ncbi:MAG: hypothetical protein EOO41_05420 [Methanobacteriota archaeon]|nr:MAG: hypothetical protein EOO41_05420 [Euryarchaeota archaeon]
MSGTAAATFIPPVASASSSAAASVAVSATPSVSSFFAASSSPAASPVPDTSATSSPVLVSTWTAVPASVTVVPSASASELPPATASASPPRSQWPTVVITIHLVHISIDCLRLAADIGLLNSVRRSIADSLRLLESRLSVSVVVDDLCAATARRLHATQQRGLSEDLHVRLRTVISTAPTTKEPVALACNAVAERARNVPTVTMLKKFLGTSCDGSMSCACV